MEVQPNICVSHGEEGPCNMAVSISWNARTPGDVCIKLKSMETALRCWRGASSGMVETEFNSGENETILLQSTGDGTVLVEKEITVVSRNLRDTRRRRRHVWSIL